MDNPNSHYKVAFDIGDTQGTIKNTEINRPSSELQFSNRFRIGNSRCRNNDMKHSLFDVIIFGCILTLVTCIWGLEFSSTDHNQDLTYGALWYYLFCSLLPGTILLICGQNHIYSRTFLRWGNSTIIDILEFLVNINGTVSSCILLTQSSVDGSIETYVPRCLILTILSPLVFSLPCIGRFTAFHGALAWSVSFAVSLQVISTATPVTEALIVTLSQIGMYQFLVAIAMVYVFCKKANSYYLKSQYDSVTNSNDVPESNKFQQAQLLKQIISHVSHDMLSPLQALEMGLESLGAMISLTNHRNSLSPFYNKEKSQQNTPTGTFYRFSQNVSIGQLNTTRSPGSDLFGDDKALVSETVHTMQCALALMTMIITRSLDASSVTAGVSLSPNIERFDVRTSVRAVVDCIEALESVGAIHVNFTPNNPVYFIQTDKRWFEGNLLCVLSNAVKYSVHLNDECRIPIEVCVTIVPSTDPSLIYQHYMTSFNSLGKDIEYKVVVVEVTDSGEELNSSQMDRFFVAKEPDERSTVGGLGLGLFTLAKRIEALGGECHVRKRMDGVSKGSLVSFAIPIHGDADGRLSPDSVTNFETYNYTNQVATAVRSPLSLNSGSRFITPEQQNNRLSQGDYRAIDLPLTTDTPNISEKVKDSNMSGGSLSARSDGVNISATSGSGKRKHTLKLSRLIQPIREDIGDQRTYSSKSISGIGAVGARSRNLAASSGGGSSALGASSGGVATVESKSKFIHLETYSEDNTGAIRSHNLIMSQTLWVNHDFRLRSESSDAVESEESSPAITTTKSRRSSSPDLSTPFGVPGPSNSQFTTPAEIKSRRSLSSVDMSAKSTQYPSGMLFQPVDNETPVLEIGKMFSYNSPFVGAAPSKVSNEEQTRHVQFPIRSQFSRQLQPDMQPDQLPYLPPEQISPPQQSTQALHEPSQIPPSPPSLLQAHALSQQPETTQIAPQTGPTDDTAAKNQADRDVPRDPPTTRLSVLVVDDSLPIVKMTRVNLEKAGHQVDSAKNGKEALEKMKTQVYDLVLMDIQMPVMGGVESTRLVREFEAEVQQTQHDFGRQQQNQSSSQGPQISFPNARVVRRQFIIGMSANGEVATREEALDAGMDAFLSKPFSLDAIMNVVQQQLHQGNYN